MNQEPVNHLMDSNEDYNVPKPSCFNPLFGESVQFIGKCAEGNLTLTNYKLILQYAESTYHVPLGVIEQTELKKVFCLHILCKDARIYKCTFSTSEVCMDWQKRISDATMMPLCIEKHFAFTYYYNSLNENQALHSFFSSQLDGTSSYTHRSDKIFNEEVKRLGFDIAGAWRISLANENYKLCPSYPRRIIVPSSISDASLEGVAKFRSSRRIPTVVWRHPNGAVIARSSQPEVGWLGWRSTEDEDLIKAISEACAYDSPSTNQVTASVISSSSSLQAQTNDCLHSDQSNEKSDNGLNISDLSSICDLPEAKQQSDIKKLLVMDARSYATAVANRARGGGCECLDYYPMCEIQFMNLDNIHTIRKSHQSLRLLDTVSPDAPNWLSLLENTRWLYHISGLIRAAVIVAQTISVEGRPVLVHCSDGWDRTPQITALAEILLDPYYRTLEGFQVLVEREWIEFGHKFSDRNGCGIGSEDLNERCPVFLQWIDCVHQIMNQYPTMFQFNQAYLVKLAQHVYSNLFGTFLFNSSQERYLNEQQHGKNIPYSVWPLFRLHQHRYINYLYSHSNQVLLPAYNLKDLVFWKAVYVSKLQEEKSFNADETTNKRVEETIYEGELVKTKSCDNLLSLSMDSSSNSIGVRRLSDSNLKDKDSSTNMDLLKSALGSDGFEENSVCQLDKDLDKEKDVDLQPDNSQVAVASEHSMLASPGIKDNDSEEGCRNLNGETTEDNLEEEVHGKEFSLLKAKREIDKRSIEGSTDTLVSEVGVLGSEVPTHSVQSCYQETKNSSANSFSSILVEPQLNEHKLSEEKKGVKSFATRNPNLDEKRNEETQFTHSIVTSTVAACSTCLKNRKGYSDSGDIDMWKPPPSSSEDIIHTPAVSNILIESRTQKVGPNNVSHSASNSSCIPSTPNEDRYSTHHHHEKMFAVPFSDGLSSYSDDITRRMNEMRISHQSEVDQLRKELQVARSYIMHLMHSKANQTNGENHTEDQVSLPESVGSGSGDSVGPESSGMSDGSWENLEDFRPTILWYPDHAVDSCMGCHSRFWIGRRKHHCRSCGKIFCAECSGNSAPIPKENLFQPVRVCGNCFSSLLEFRPKYVQVASN